MASKGQCNLVSMFRCPRKNNFQRRTEKQSLFIACCILIFLMDASVAAFRNLMIYTHIFMATFSLLKIMKKFSLIFMLEAVDILGSLHDKIVIKRLSRT